MDEVFRALNDPGRRKLLDALFADDGQTLAALCAHLPHMTRFGVMSHLRVLEDAGLVTARKVGRNKHHYLNPVPIRLVHDRWISKYTQATLGRMAEVKRAAEDEQGGGTPMETPSHVYQSFIKASPDEVWNAIVDGDATQKYFYGTRVDSAWEPGAPIRYLAQDGTVVADGEIISIDPGNRLEMTFVPHWDPVLEAEGGVREAWIVEDAGDATKLTVEMYDVAPGTKTFDDFVNGFPYVISGMKTLLETGLPLAG